MHFYWEAVWGRWRMQAGSWSDLCREGTRVAEGSRLGKLGEQARPELCRSREEMDPEPSGNKRSGLGGCWDPGKRDGKGPEGPWVPGLGISVPLTETGTKEGEQVQGHEELSFKHVEFKVGQSQDRVSHPQT